MQPEVDAMARRIQKIQKVEGGETRGTHMFVDFRSTSYANAISRPLDKCCLVGSLPPTSNWLFGLVV